MAIEVKHRPAPELQMEMSEYAGQGQYRKWLADYKSKQEQAKTAAFLSAFGQGSKIGLARRAENQAGAMQTQRFGHESGLQDTRIKAQTERDRIKAINDRKLAKIRQIQGALGAAQTVQGNTALITGANEQGSSPIKDFVHANTRRRLGGTPYNLWSDGDKAQAAQMVRNIYQGGTTQEGLSTVYGQQFNQAMKLGRQNDQRFGAYSVGRGGGVGNSRAQGAFAVQKEQVGKELSPSFSNMAQEGVKGFQSKVANGVTIIKAQGTPGMRGFVPAIKGTGTGQYQAFGDEASKVYMTAPEAASGIRGMRSSLSDKFRRDVDSIAQERMKSSWQPTHREGTPINKKWYSRTVDGVEEFEQRDNVAPGQFADEYNAAPGGNFEQMEKEDAGYNEMRLPYVESWNKFQESLSLQGSMTKEEWIAELKENGYDKWYWGGKGEFVEMPEDGWAVGAPFPGIPMEGMDPSRGRQYDPHESKEHWETKADGTHNRSYRRTWMVAPTSYNNSRNENDDRSLNRLHRRMQQKAMEGGPGGENGRGESQAWRAYVDKYGHAPDLDLQKKFLNWQARKQLDSETKFLRPKGVERENIVDLRQEPLDKDDMRTLGVAMEAQKIGWGDRWKTLSPARKAKFRRLFHLFDLQSGYADAYPKEREALEWMTYSGDKWDDPNVPAPAPDAGDGGSTSWADTQRIVKGQADLDPPPPRLPRGIGPEGTDPQMIRTEGYGLYGETRQEVSTNFPSIAKGWAIRVGDKLMYLENPDPEALHRKGAPPPPERPDPNVLDPNKEPPPPPSAATVLAKPGQSQADSNIRAREAPSVGHQRAVNEIRKWVGTNGSRQDRQDMILLDKIWKEHGNSMDSVNRSNDRIEYLKIIKRLHLSVFVPGAESQPREQDTMP